MADGSTVLVEGVTLTDQAFTDGGGFIDDGSGGIAVLLSDGGFPRGEERLHTLDDDSFVVDHGNPCARKSRRALAQLQRRSGSRWRGGHAWYRDAETRAAPGFRIDAHGVIEQHGESAHDRESQAHALAAVTTRISDLIELFEDVLALRGGMPMPESQTSITTHRSRRRAPTTTPPLAV